MSKPSAPSPPDPSATAAAQTQSNVSTAAANAALGNVNQFTPYGSTTYQQTGSYTTPSGETVPQYSQYTEMSPLGQSILTGEQGLTNSVLPTAQTLADQAGASATKPLNFMTPYSDLLSAGPQAVNENVSNALYGQQKSFLDPQWNQQQQQLGDQLAQQGIPVGSAAYDNAMQQFNNSKTQAYQSAQDSAIGQGAQAANSMFNEALQGQQQNIAQQQLAESNPISLMQQLLGGAPSTQSQPVVTPAASQIAPTDTLGAQALSTQASQQAYQNQLASSNATFGGLASLGGTGLLALALMPK